MISIYLATINPAPSIIKSSINPSISRTKSPIKEATATINETGRNLIAADEMDTNVIKYIELLFTNGINVNYNNSFLFDHLEKQKYFFTQSICHFSNRYKSDEINALLIVKLMQFIREKISIESIWTKVQLSQLLKNLIEPIPNMKNIKIFIAENGQFEIIKLVQYLVVIIKYMNKNGNDIIKQQCCNCIMDILSHNKLMEHMKCGNTPTNSKETFKNILSIPCSNIVNKIPQQPQIENTYLLLLWIGRYPYYLKYNINIEWEFIHLNNTNNFNCKQRINSLQICTIITVSN